MVYILVVSNVMHLWYQFSLYFEHRLDEIEIHARNFASFFRTYVLPMNGWADSIDKMVNVINRKEEMNLFVQVSVREFILLQRS